MKAGVEALPDDVEALKAALIVARAEAAAARAQQSDDQAQQGRAVAANSTCRWSHCAYAISRRTSSSVCASLISDRPSQISEVRQMPFLDPRRAQKKDRLAAVSPSPTSALIKQLA
jgi:hypothetical protein